MGKRKDLKNKKFARLFVKEYSHTLNKKAYWKVICDCGIEKCVQATLLLNETTQSCGCLQKEKASSANKKFSTNPALRKLIDSYRNSAKRRGWNFNLSVELSDKFFSKNCHYCNSGPSLIFKEYNGKYTYKYNGIDRINNNKDYTEDNIVTCCKICNYSKNEMSIGDFFEWIKKIYNHSILGNK